MDTDTKMEALGEGGLQKNLSLALTWWNEQQVHSVSYKVCSSKVPHFVTIIWWNKV